MKKKAFAAAAAVVLLLAVIGAVTAAAVRNSPEYALLNAAKDIQESGLEGLKPHLTGDALEVMETIDTLSDNAIVSKIWFLLDGNGYMDELKSELAEVEWSLDDVRKDSGQAQISLGFNYKENVVGTIRLTMIQEKKAWKISEIGIPDFDKLEWIGG